MTALRYALGLARYPDAPARGLRSALDTRLNAQILGLMALEENGAF